VAYLLQRIENFEGVVVLASNLHHNLHEAFLCRFEEVVDVPPLRAQ
jgi:SpoVK/Ycf46/Vps4 family AAA+-type ATPase